jgi:hypothetical protein
VVNGDKTSPTAAYVGHRGWPKYVPSVWGQSWATLPPGVYKFSGLALLVGSWATG